jgi:two-component system response regulator HydG
MKRILVIDDDTYICELLVNYLKDKGNDVQGAFTGNKALKILEKSEFDVVLCDFRLPDTDGYKLLKEIKSRKPSTAVIIMTAYTDVKMAVRLIKNGAFDYVTKPIQPEEILRLIQDATTLKKSPLTGSSFQDEFVTGKSEGIARVLKHVKAVAPTELTVLIEGETGSGKEYIAKAIHYSSERKNKPFIAVDCGAIPKELANSELFGHIKGAFTGAINDKRGYFDQAKGGTLFLDEVGNLPYENQVKLLRALQERIINRVGDNKSIKVDVRLISASNDDLLKQVENKDFREDLYHRLNGFKIHIPPLRERKEDLMEFAHFFIDKANRAFAKNVQGLDDDAMRLFLGYSWYGNIRELKNVINRAVLLSEKDEITAESLPEEIRFFNPEKSAPSLNHKSDITDLKEATLVTEREVITEALSKTNYNKSKAAKLLNIDRKTLYNKIKQYNIELEKS